MIVAGGLHGLSGAVFIYKSQDWLNWTPLNHTLFPHYKQDMGNAASYWDYVATQLHEIPSLNRPVDGLFEVPSLWVLNEEVNGARNNKQMPMVSLNR
jgi:hypothetical protein